MNYQHRLHPGTLVLGLSLALCGCGGSGGTNPIVVKTPAPIVPTGTFTQIERLSRPAIKEVFEKFVDHQVSNATEPYDMVNDPLKGEIQGFEDAVRPPSVAAGTDYGKALAGLLYPDEYTVDLSQTAQSFLGNEIAGNFGGRNPNEDVVDVELGALFGNTLSALAILPDDGEENACLAKQNITQNPTQKTTSTFPYFAVPH